MKTQQKEKIIRERKFANKRWKIKKDKKVIYQQRRKDDKKENVKKKASIGLQKGRSEDEDLHKQTCRLIYLNIHRNIEILGQSDNEIVKQIYRQGWNQIKLNRWKNIKIDKKINKHR